MNIDMQSLIEIITNAAREELLPRFTRVKRGHKADGSVITEADLAMQQRIATELNNKWPDVLFLGEEMEADEHESLLKSGKPLWILDPLDGTSNFSIGIPYFSVSLALLENGSITTGIVYDPVRDECFTAQRGQGAYINDEQLTASDARLELEQTTALIDFKRLSAELATRIFSEQPYSSQRSFGSVALDWCWIAAGRSHIYLHGRQNIWDYAAGYLVLSETGGLCTTLDGEDVFVAEMKPRSAVAALDKKLFDAWTQWLGIEKP